MLQQLFRPIADYWLRDGNKYLKSAELAGAAWHVPVQTSLLAHGLSLEGRTTPQAVVDVFRPRWNWRPDAVLQLWDMVDPPQILLAHDGEDCDGWAMAHAQACEYALARFGWRSVVVSYYADPWQVSHHYAVTIDPHGACYVLQPQPSAAQPDDQQVVFGPFASIEATLQVVPAWYKARAEWWDVRTPMYAPLAG